MLAICSQIFLVMGLSTFHPGYTDESFNNDNHLFGVECGNVQVATFNNSYYERSYALTYNHSIIEPKGVPIELGTSYSLVTGYEGHLKAAMAVSPMVTFYADLGPVRFTLIPGMSEHQVGPFSAISISIRGELN